MNIPELKDTPENRLLLGRIVAELTQKGKHKHSKGEYGEPDDPHYDGWCTFCTKCKTKLWHAGQQIAGHYTDESRNPCSVPDPITIDNSDACMGMAVRMFRETELYLSSIQHLPFFKSQQEAFVMWVNFNQWYRKEATPFELMKIVAIAPETPKN